MRYDQLYTLVAFLKPKTIIEIGTNSGERGIGMSEEALRHRPHVSYTGYDVFDSEDDAFHQRAFNGKGFFARSLVEERFEALRRQHAAFAYRLIEGRTSETLHGKTARADFVFIDGDHRTEAIDGDFQAVRESNVIVFDDYYGDNSPIDRARFGCNQIVERLGDCLILPAADQFEHTGDIRMAARIRPYLQLGQRPIWLPRLGLPLKRRQPSAMIPETT